MMNEFVVYLMNFNAASKRIMKVSMFLVFILLIGAMYFALSAGRTNNYYESMNLFLILIENAKAIFGIGCLFALLIEPVCKKYDL